MLGTSSRRAFLWGAAAAAATMALGRRGFAAAYPSRQINIIVPYSPGGASDTIARLVSDKMRAKTGQQVVVDYKEGGGGAIGANFVSHAKPDGYTLLQGTNSFFTTIPRLMKVSYDPAKDLVPVVMAGDAYMPMAVNSSLPVKSFKELVDYAKANPGKLAFGSSGIGTIGHLSCEYMKKQFGLNVTHVPYKGGSAAINALVSGEVQIGVDTGSSEFILNGQLRGLAILGKRRWDRLPSVPTIEEAGIPNWPVRSWHTVVVPGRTPPEIIMSLNSMINEFIMMPDIATKLRAFGLEPAVLSIAEVGDRIKADIAAFGVIMDAIGLKPR